MTDFGQIQNIIDSAELLHSIRQAVYEYHTPEEFKIHSFVQQIVNGINYFVKFQADKTWYFAKTYSSCDQNTIEVIFRQMLIIFSLINFSWLSYIRF